MIWKSLIVCMGVAGVGAVLFACARDEIIAVVLGSRYQAASPYILGYLTGDVFRVAENIALFSALAAKRLLLFVMIEAGLALLVGATMLTGIAFWDASAAYWGYIAAHVAAFLLVVRFRSKLARL